MVRSQKGITLLEVLISLVLFMVTIMTFAMVFPSGYQLNSKLLRESRGVQVAQGVMEELNKIPIYDIGAASPTNPSLWYLRSWNSLNSWTPAILQDPKVNPDYPTSLRYTLPQNPPGIQVQFISGGNPFNISDNPLVAITVTLFWQDQTRATAVVNRVVLTTYRTYNR